MGMDVEVLRLVMDKYPSLSVEETTDLVGKYLICLAKMNVGIANGQVASSPVSGASDNVAPMKLKVNPHSAIQADKIVCCICGDEFKTLTKGHLAEHGLTRDTYLDLCGYAKNTPLMCRDQIAARKASVQESKPWEKTKRWQEKQKKQEKQEEAAKAVLASEKKPVEDKDHSTPPSITA